MMLMRVMELGERARKRERERENKGKSIKLEH